MDSLGLKKVHNELIEKYQKDNVQTGFFNGNHMMIIGQNPGNPYSEKQQQETQEVVNTVEFASHMAMYEKMLKKTKIGKFISEITDDWNHLSFTNVVKIPTKDNAAPSFEMFEEFMPYLEKQIFMSNPNLILILGAATGRYFCAFNKVKFKKYHILNDFKIPVLIIDHPSYLSRTRNTERTLLKVDQILNDFYKNIVIRVTNSKIYYRNHKFEKKIRTNPIDNDKMYVTQEFLDQYAIKEFNKTEFITIKKKPVFEIEKFDVESKIENFDILLENHLQKKHLYYYENYKKIKHSKCVKIFYFDIETDRGLDVEKTDKPIISIVLFDSHTKKKFCWVLQNGNQEITDKTDVIIYHSDDEKKLLYHFFKFLSINDPDVIIGWNSDRFDVPYLMNRAQHLKIPVYKYFDNFRQINFDRKFIFKTDNLFFYDAYTFYKQSTYYNKPPNYKLDTVGQFLFKEGKTEKTESIGDLWRHHIDRLISYNIQDVYLLKRICDKANITTYPLQLQQICPQDFVNALYNSKTIENLLHYHFGHIYKFPSKVTHQKKAFKGAVVFETNAGRYKNVGVFDFSAMYTSIIISCNFSADTLVESPEEESPDDFIIDNYRFSTRQDGILRVLESMLLTRRKEYQKMRDSFDAESTEYKVYDELQGTFKTILNSIYGINAYSRFILFKQPVAESITSFARKLIHHLGDLSESMGYKVRYGDTDSIFIEMKAENFKEAHQQAIQLTETFNKSFSKFLSKFTTNPEIIKNDRDGKINLEYEKMFEKIFFTNVKKRYFGDLKFYKGKILECPKFSVTGFETRRDDTPPFFKKKLTQIYKFILNDDIENLRYYIRDIKQEIENLNDVSPLLIRKNISKEIEDYKVIPQHLRAIMRTNIPFSSGDTVQMVYTKDSEGVIHVEEPENFNSAILDIDKYIDAFINRKIELIDPNNYLYIVKNQSPLKQFFK